MNYLNTYVNQTWQPVYSLCYQVLKARYVLWAPPVTAQADPWQCQQWNHSVATQAGGTVTVVYNTKVQHAKSDSSSAQIAASSPRC